MTAARYLVKRVFAAEDRALGRPVAIKLSTLDTPPGRDLFQREAHNAARLCHPNIVTVYDCGETLDGQPYYTMELVDGLTLRELVASTGRQPPARVAHILAQLADALAETIERGMIHGDVKPANVMLCRAGRRHDLIKLLDFGVMTKLGNEPARGSRKTLMGTAAYLAPELVHGAAPDEYSEMYSLGLVGYYLLTGTHPFAVSAAGTLANAQATVPEAPSVRIQQALPPLLERQILRCLAICPKERAPSMICLAGEFRRSVEPRWQTEDAEFWWQAHATQLACVPAARSVLLDRSETKLAATVNDVRDALGSVTRTLHLKCDSTAPAPCETGVLIVHSAVD